MNQLGQNEMSLDVIIIHPALCFSNLLVPEIPVIFGEHFLEKHGTRLPPSLVPYTSVYICLYFSISFFNQSVDKCLKFSY